MDRAVVQRPRHHAAAAPVFHDQIEREVLDEELRVVAQALPVERMQHRVPGAVGRRARALDRRLAVVLRHAAEGALIDLAFFGTAERHAEMLKLVDGFRRVAAQILDRVLIAEPVRPLHGVVHVPAPIVGLHVAERRRDAALRRDRMAARRKHLGDVGDLQPVPRRLKRRAQTRTARADDDDVKV